MMCVLFNLEIDLVQNKILHFKTCWGVCITCFFFVFLSLQTHNTIPQSHSVPQSPVHQRHQHSTHSHHNNNLMPPTSSPYMFSSMEEGLEDLETYQPSRHSRRRRASYDDQISSSTNGTPSHHPKPKPPQSSCVHNKNYPCSKCLDINTAAVYLRPHSAKPSEDTFLHRRSCPPSDKENSFDDFAIPVGVPPKTPATRYARGDPRQQVQGGSVRRKKTPVKTPVVPTLSLPVPAMNPSRSMDNNLHLVTSSNDEFQDVQR